MFVPSSVNGGYLLTNFKSYEDNKFSANIDPTLLLDFMYVNRGFINFDTLMAVFYSRSSLFNGLVTGPVFDMEDIKYSNMQMCCAFLNGSDMQVFRQCPKFINIHLHGKITDDEVFIFNIGKYLWHLCYTANMQTDNGPAITCFSTVLTDSVRSMVHQKGQPAMGTINRLPHMFTASGNLYDAIMKDRVQIYALAGYPLMERGYNFVVKNASDVRDPSQNDNPIAGDIASAAQ